MHEAIEFIQSAGHVIIVAHKDPDGDAIGALLGLNLALRAMGKGTTPACDDETPWHLGFLPGSADVMQDLSGVNADLVVVVDCSDHRRTGKVGQQAAALGAPLVNIDHHVTNTHFGTVNLVEPEAVSATEMIFDLLQLMDFEPDADIATCLLTGIVTDTRGFRTNSVKRRTLEVASDLMDLGASLTYITRMALDRRKYHDLALLGRALGRVRREDGVIWSSLSRQDRRELDPDSTGIMPRKVSSALNTVDDAAVAVFFSEKDDDDDGNNAIDISIRAKPGYDLSVLFREGGALAGRGGGHPLASGAEAEGPLEAVVEQVVEALKVLVRQQAG